MGDRSSINTDELKSRMDDLFILTSQVQYGDKHPLRIVQASKSLIGINLESPPKVLLKWLEYYMQDFIPDFNLQFLNIEEASPEIITFIHFKNLILKKKAVESHIYLSYLLQVAGVTQIAEYLVELGVSKSPSSLLFCWSALRSIQFLGEKDGSLILNHCISKLLEDEECKIIDEVLYFEQYEVYCHQFQIRKTDIVRKNKIIPHLDKMILAIDRELIKIRPQIMPINLCSIIQIEGEKGIISFLATLKVEEITADLILMLDAVRSLLKFSDDPKDPFLLHILNNHKEKACVK